MSDEFNKLRATALAWLGRQEYHLAKFRQKLKDKEASEEDIERIVSEFTECDWLSEQRYCEYFVRSRITKGQGKIRIRADGQQKRLDKDCLHQALDEAEVDWFEQALATYERKYGDKPIADAKEKAKRMRFMQYRGFNMDQTLYAMADPDEQD
ncbi:MAG: regulatory protein [Phenylobacterium sp.]|jgi:regulatory protein